MMQIEMLPIALYGSATPRHNPGEHQHVDGGSARPQQRAGAGVYRRARGEHIIDKQESSSGHFGSASRWHTKGALHVLGPLGLIKPDLLRRRLDPLQSPMRDHSTARVGDDMGQQRRLVEPARPLSAAMQPP